MWVVKHEEGSPSYFHDLLYWWMF